RILVVIDGIEDLEAASLGVLEDLVLLRPSTRLALLMTCRAPDAHADNPPLSRMLLRLQNSDALAVEHLGPMRESGVSALCRGRCPYGAATPRCSRDVGSSTGGNPQWVEAVLGEVAAMPDPRRAAYLTGSAMMPLVPAAVVQAVELRMSAFREERFLADALA